MIQFAQKNYQVTPEQVGIRDIAELYLRIQENTEFLTHIFRYQPGRKREVFSVDNPNVDIKSLFNLIVQTSYLLYTCSIRKVSILLSHKLHLFPNKDNAVQIVREYLLEAEYLSMDEENRKVVESSFQFINPYKYENAYAESVLHINQSYLKIMRQHLQKHKDKKLMSDKIFKRNFDNITNSIKILFPLLNNGLKPKLLISCLEQTEVFRTNSYLLQILNCSIYESIRKKGKFKETLQDIKHKQMLLAQYQGMMYQDNSMNREYDMLENSIEQILKYFLKQGIIDIDVSYNSNSTDSKQSVKLGTSEVNKFDQRSSIWKIKVHEKKYREFNEQILHEIETGITAKQVISNELKTKSEKSSYFILEYYPQRNILGVKYITDVEITVENHDALMYHCNNMMAEWNNVSFQQIEKQQGKNNKRKQKCIAFKVVSYFNVKDSPFINLLLLIDMAMIYGKVSEPELTRKVIKLDDYGRFTLAGKKINHLTQLFIKKIRRLYESSSIKQSSY